LTAQEWESQNEDYLLVLSPEVRIKIVDDARDLIVVRIDYAGYEPYEPSPYDGTYSEM